MKIGIISDIHDNVENLEWAVKKIQELQVDKVFALGDYSSPYIVERLGLIGVPIAAVWGNNDGDKITMLRVVQTDENNLIKFERDVFAEIKYDGELYFIAHYALLAENAAMSGKYKAVFHGHTHKQREEILNSTLIVNPGKLASYPKGVISFAIYDTKSGSVKFMEM